MIAMATDGAVATDVMDVKMGGGSGGCDSPCRT